MGTRVHVSHAVPASQYEPGIPPEQQAMRHAQTLDLLNTDLTLSYVLTKRLELSLRIPIRVVRSSVDFLDYMGRELDGFKSIHHRNETITGLDDLVLQARLRMVSPSAAERLRLDFKFGLSLPIAAIEPDPFELGQQGLSHQHVFFGTGTFDPMLGIQFEYGVGDIVLGSDTEWTGSLYSNRYGYRGSISLTQRLSLGPSLKTTNWGPVVGAEFFKEFAARWANEVAENSGRMEISPTLALRANADTAFSAMVLVKTPFILSAQSATLDVPLVIMISAQGAVDTR